MTGRKLLTLALLLASVVLVRANGDPVAVHSAITLSPTPVAVHMPEVKLVDEYVTFVPNGLYTTVTVRYLLHNHSSRSFDSLPYGFPIDYLGEGPAHWGFLDDYTESQMELGWRDSYIRNVTFMLGDRQLQWQCSRDTMLTPPRPYLSEAEWDTTTAEGKHEFDSLYAIYGDSLYSYTNAVSRRWYYTWLDIPASSYVTLEVSYQVANTYGEGLYLCSEVLVNLRDEYSHRMMFQYDFTPAAYWGDGHAGHFSVWLDTANISIIKEWDEDPKAIGGLPMQERGHWLCYEASRFDLAAAQPFSIDFHCRPLQPHQQLDRLFNHRIDPSEYTVRVSGADRKYPAANLSDLNPGTATVLRPDKNDSLYITIRFKQPTVVEGMLILNGYTKNADTWRNNSRIGSLRVHDTVAYFTYLNPENNQIDTSGHNDENMLFGEREWIVKYTQYHPLPEPYPMGEPQGYDWQSLVDNALILYMQAPWVDNHISEINIVIGDTAKGLKYDDLCVSEIILIRK